MRFLITLCSLFPQLRPGPDIQQREILNAFWSFFSDASAILRSPGVKEYTIGRDMYKFYARGEGVHRIYLLLTLDAGQPDLVANEVLKSIRNFD
jgi:hypothetical protein